MCRPLPAMHMCRPLRVLSWNMCCLTHPLSASWSRIAIGALVGRSWHDEARDSTIRPLDAHNVARLERQAEYILRSESGVVLLQKVPGVATLSKLLEILSRDDRPATSPSPAAAHGDDMPAEGRGGYEALYATQRPLAAGYVAYTAFAFLLGLAQRRLCGRATVRSDGREPAEEPRRHQQRRPQRPRRGRGDPHRGRKGH